MFPIRDDNPHFLTPLVTYFIIIVNLAAWYFLQGLGAEPALSSSVCSMGIIPAEFLNRLPASQGSAVAGIEAKAGVLLVVVVRVEVVEEQKERAIGGRLLDQTHSHICRTSRGTSSLTERSWLRIGVKTAAKTEARRKKRVGNDTERAIPPPMEHFGKRLEALVEPDEFSANPQCRGILTRQDARNGRERPRRCARGIPKEDPVFGERRNMGRSFPLVTIGTHVIGAERVDHDHDDVRVDGFRFGAGFGLERATQRESE